MGNKNINKRSQHKTEKSKKPVRNVKIVKDKKFVFVYILT